jgi:hypothetical protein
MARITTKLGKWRVPNRFERVSLRAERDLRAGAAPFYRSYRRRSNDYAPARDRSR